MTSRVPQMFFDRLFDAILIIIMGLPEDENEDEEDHNEEDEEPAVIREPDEC